MLNTVPPDFVHLDPPRAALCLVGQIAAPLQALWVAAHIQQWQDKIHGHTAITDPLLVISQFKLMLLQQRHDVWILPSMFVPRTLATELDGARTEVRVHKPVTAGQLVEAELAVAGHVITKVCSAGRMLKTQSLLHASGQLYVLHVQPPVAAPIHRTEQATSDTAIWWGLQELLPVTEAAQVRVLPATVADIALFMHSQGRIASLPRLPPLRANETLYVPFLHQGHWALLVLSRRQDRVDALCYDGMPQRSVRAASTLAEALSCLLCCSIEPVLEVTHILQSQPSDCGAFLLAHAVCHAVPDVPFTQHLQNAQDFLSRIPWLAGTLYGHGGLSEDQMSALKMVLQEHGVPPEAVEARVQQACQKLPAAALSQALVAPNPWQALKGIASQPSHSFRWVLPDELKIMIERKASEKFGTTIPAAKQRKQKGHKGPATIAPLSLDPAQLQMAPDSFSSAGGQPLCQLAFKEVQPLATGVCFCSPQQIAPFLRDHKHISVDALALVTTAELPPETLNGTPVTGVRYPAIYAPTAEAVLITGSLLQLGDEAVQLTPSTIAEVDQVDLVP